jgi:hypothetical protein
MKNKFILWIGVVIVAILMIFVVLNLEDANKPFNKIKLPNNNNTVNIIFPTYYDTIMSVALNELGIKNQVISFYQLTDGAKNNFEGDLKAHIRYHLGIFYLYTENMNRKTAISVLSHEAVHIQQYVSGELYYSNGIVSWRGQNYDLNTIKYDEREWENEAFKKGNSLAIKVEQILW